MLKVAFLIGNTCANVLAIEDEEEFLRSVDPEWLAQWTGGYQVLPDGSPVDVGWTWDGSRWTAPNPYEGMTLDQARALRFAEVDAMTDTFFARGFEYMDSGIWLSLSLESQNRMTGLMLVKDSPLITYPIRWNANNDDHYLDVENPDMVMVMYACAARALRSYVDGGTLVKDAIRAAKTVDEVMAVRDPR